MSNFFATLSKGKILLVLLLLSGCTTSAGPFITNISYDGDSTLLVEKCYAEYSSAMSTVGNSNCTQSTIVLRKSELKR